MTPVEFAERINEWARGTMVTNHGTRGGPAGRGRAAATLDFKPGLTQLTGRLPAGGIVALAGETATAAAIWETNPSAELRQEPFPLTPRLAVDLVDNVDRGPLTAEAEIAHRGRTTIVVEVRVRDDAGRLAARLGATQLTPSAA